jgi:mono/diheme cytochrome c family protein
LKFRLSMRISARFAATFALGGVLLLTGACRQDMHNQPKYVPYRSSEFFPDGLSERQQVVGTVARDQLHTDEYLYTGKIGAKEQDVFPFPITQAVMERGRARYDIYCSPCHSRVGDGNGMIVKRGYRQAANFHDPKIIALPVGHYFDVITHGWGAMPDYAAQIEPADRWAIAAYIRALQYAQNGTMAEVPAEQRSGLKEQSQITVDGVPLAQALASAGKGSSEEVSAAGANPLPSRQQPSEEGTKPK